MTAAPSTVSVVIITRNEAPRLRLTLESLFAQRITPAYLADLEVVVVDDASTDGTSDVLAELQGRADLRVVRHEESRGRSGARNAGAAVASGELLIFLDGDVLAAPDLVTRHLTAHAVAGILGRGETHHLRCTRFFSDPETGSPMPGEEARVLRMGDELQRSLVTRQQVRERFHEVAARGEPGIYAGAGPRTLYELEMAALREMPDARIMWMAASGHNFSVRRADFEAAGGYDSRISMNEHRELAFRLYQRGLKVALVEGARSFHMLHRIGGRDPLMDTEWETIFYGRHPCLATKLMSVFFLSLAGDKGIPEEARILSLTQLEAIVRDGSCYDYDALRRSHPKLVDLDAKTPGG
jgi:glycosyltransferase involved in cell wall biosynthesis